jgi:hypothetical protein
MEGAAEAPFSNIAIIRIKRHKSANINPWQKLEKSGFLFFYVGTFLSRQNAQKFLHFGVSELTETNRALGDRLTVIL